MSEFSSKYVQGYVVIWAISDLQKDFRFRRIRNLFLFRVVPWIVCKEKTKQSNDEWCVQ